MIAKIPLTRGLFATVDSSDLELLSKHVWHAGSRDYRKFNAQTNVRLPDGRRITLKMHRYLMQPEPGMHIGHRNGDPLDNRRSNLWMHRSIGATTPRNRLPVVRDDGTAYLPLSMGQVAIIDASDVPLVSAYTWHAKPDVLGKFYAQAKMRTQKTSGHRQSTLRLHRLILSPPDGMMVDHINGDPLDNRRVNLRICDDRQNQQNRKRARGRFKGVYWHTKAEVWRATIVAGDVDKNGRRRKISLGSFTDEIDAARAYDRAALKYFGEFAALNFPDSINDSEKETG